MHRFKVKNILSSVSPEQFKETALSLEKAIKQFRENIEGKLLLTTTLYDYYWLNQTFLD